MEDFSASGQCQSSIISRVPGGILLQSVQLHARISGLERVGVGQERSKFISMTNEPAGEYSTLLDCENGFSASWWLSLSSMWSPVPLFNRA